MAGGASSDQIVVKRTLQEWDVFLNSLEREYTLEEVTALYLKDIKVNLIYIRNYLQDSAEATRHLEGMVGAMDAHLDVSSGGNYPGSATIREALALHRAKQAELSDKKIKSLTGKKGKKS